MQVGQDVPLGGSSRIQARDGRGQAARPSTEPPRNFADVETIEATFRNGSLTAVSVVVGFSLAFLNRWAGLPGAWNASDFAALGPIGLGILFQIASVVRLLSVRSLRLAHYNRSVTLFLLGLALVVLGVGVAIVGDVAGHGQRVLGAGGEGSIAAAAL